MILICYDGSDDARSAIERAGELLRGQPAIVLTIWVPFTQVLTHTMSGFGMTAGFPDTDEIDEASRKAAESWPRRVPTSPAKRALRRVPRLALRISRLPARSSSRPTPPMPAQS